MGTRATSMEETKYDRPSLHSSDPVTRAIGRITAVMSQHQYEEHHSWMGALGWYDFCCNECGFDARAKCHELYPGD